MGHPAPNGGLCSVGLQKNIGSRATENNVVNFLVSQKQVIGQS